jgi:transposase
MHERWLAKQTFSHPAQQIVFQDHLEVINAAQVRLAALEQQLREIVPTWTMAPVVAAYQSMRGVSFVVAVTFVAEVGDVRRFATPQQLMAFLGLVPSERTTGDTVRRGSITKAGNHRARRVLIEGAWTYRYPARVGETLRSRLKDLPLSVRSIAWKAQVRLCARHRRLIANGKLPAVATTAIARELAAFLWAIGQQVAPQKPAT